MVEDERFEVREFRGCNSPHGFDWENGIYRRMVDLFK